MLPCHGVNEGATVVQIAAWDLCSNDDKNALSSNDGSALQEVSFDFAADEAMEKLRKFRNGAASNHTSSLVACVQLQPGSVEADSSDVAELHAGPPGVAPPAFEAVTLRDFSDAINRVSLHVRMRLALVHGRHTCVRVVPILTVF